MTRARRWVRRLLFAGLLFGADAPAVADTPPTLWERARYPERARSWKIHAEVQEALMTVADLDRRDRARVAFLQRARAVLRDACRAEDVDPLLEFDLGHVTNQLEMHDEAVVVLHRVLRKAKTHPLARTAWSALADSYSKMGRQAEELYAYEQYLAFETDDSRRVVPLLNMAEAKMHLQRLPEAIADYKEVLRLSSTLPVGFQSTTVLAVWGLAVALDRAGETTEALNQARLGVEWDPVDSLLRHDPDVYFVPPFERNWYLGLSAEVRARRETQPSKAARHWAEAEFQWDGYVKAAPPTGRWVELAKIHRDDARKARKAAERKAGRSGLAPTWTGEDEED